MMVSLVDDLAHDAGYGDEHNIVWAKALALDIMAVFVLVRLVGNVVFQALSADDEITHRHGRPVAARGNHRRSVPVGYSPEFSPYSKVLVIPRESCSKDGLEPL